ncbi:MAG TPA: phage major capsid protein [Smithellaceae bacterium]|nr:phage major capsid protein [Smithellaceae bacterium]
MSETSAVIEEIGNAVLKFKADYSERLNDIEKILARREFPGGGSSDGEAMTAAAKDHAKAFNAWARKGTDPEGLRKLEVQANLSTLSDPDGGYLVPVEIDKNIERLALASVAMRRLARIVKSKGEYTKPLSKGGATGGWVAEKASRPETDTPELTLFSPPMCEIYAMPSTTQKLLDMSDFDVEAWLLEEINDVFVTTEGTGFITGNGVSRVKGIIDSALMVANASWEYGKTGYIAGGSATLLNNADKLVDLQHALKPVYRQNGTWLMNDTTFSVIRKFKDGDGNYLWRPGLLENAADTLLGKPIAIDDNMPDIGADTYPIAFGDFKRAYTIVDHVSGVRLLRDPFTVKGFVIFYVTKRIAGGISNYEALKFLKIATS